MGTSLLLLGVAGDLFGWWAGLSYLTNVLSSLTGACFGIPVALLLIAAITDRRTAAALRRDCLRQGTLAADRLLASASPFAAANAAQDLVAPIVEIADRIAALRQTLDSPVSNDGDAAIKHELGIVGRGINEGRRRMLEALPMSISDSERHWAELSNSWRSINDVVRKDYAASDLPWMDDDTQQTLHALLHDKPNPVLYLLEMRDFHMAEYAAQCLRSSAAEGPIDRSEFSALTLHSVDHDDLFGRGLDALESLDAIRECVARASRALRLLDASSEGE